MHTLVKEKKNKSKKKPKSFYKDRLVLTKLSLRSYRVYQHWQRYIVQDIFTIVYINPQGHPVEAPTTPAFGGTLKSGARGPGANCLFPPLPAPPPSKRVKPVQMRDLYTSRSALSFRYNLRGPALCCQEIFNDIIMRPR